MQRRKRTHTNAFQAVFESQNKSPNKSLLRYVIIAVCVLLLGTIIIYEIYALRNRYDYSQIIQRRKRRDAYERRTVNVSGLSEGNRLRLYSEKAGIGELQTSKENEYSIKGEGDLILYTELSWEEECESYSLKPKHYYNDVINAKVNEIDFVFPGSDRQLYELFHSSQFLNHWDTSFLTDDYWNLIRALDADISDSDIEKLKNPSSESQAQSQSHSHSSVNKYFDFNGLSSDLSLFSKNTHSIGLGGEYWRTSTHCIEHKSCDVYPIHRVLYKSRIISCREILLHILPKIYECVTAHGKKCEHIIDSGYYRIIMKTYYERIGEDIVIKMMKPRSIKKERDYIRHIRESILLGELYDLEQETLLSSDSSDIFTQVLQGKQQKRAFNFVQEYGHCVRPLWISISPLYKMALDKWIFEGYAKQSKLSKLIHMSLQIAQSVFLLHELVLGGPYHHTDIQPRQFLLDEADNVYINDFNRGKFQPYYFGTDDLVHKCWYCGHRSRGHWRAPEEPKKRPLNEKLDIFSMGLTIWALYSNDIPFRDATFDDLTEIYFDLRRIPPMTHNMPPAIKDIITSCLKWDPRQRPTAQQVVNMLKDIYFINLDLVTQGSQHLTSQQLLDNKMWTQTNYPKLSTKT